MSTGTIYRFHDVCVDVAAMLQSRAQGLGLRAQQAVRGTPIWVPHVPLLGHGLAGCTMGQKFSGRIFFVCHSRIGVPGALARWGERESAFAF